MASDIPIHFQDLYSANYRFLVQQQDSMLRSCVTIDTFKGKRKSYPYVGKQTATEITTRAGQTQYQEPTLPKRWVNVRPFHIPNIIDEFDDELLGTLGDPRNAFVTSQAMAMKRKQDKLIVDALAGTSYSGETGTTGIALPSGQKIAVNYGGANIGLTLAKLTQAKYLLDKKFVPKGDRYFVHGAKQLNDLLLNVTEIKSSDYNQVKALVQGEVSEFMGFKFVMVEDDALPYTSSTDVRMNYAFHKSGVVLGIASDFNSTIDRIPNQNNAIQVRSTMNMDAARLEEETVVEIACDESP